MWILQSLEGGTKYSREKIQSQSVEQRLKERPSRDCFTWGSIPYAVIKPRHYCGCQEVLADRSLIQLSPDRPCQSLTNTGQMLTANHWTEHGVPNGERTEGAEGVCNPIGRTTISTSQTPQSFQALSCQQKNMGRFMVPGRYIAKNCHVWSQWERMH